MLGIGGGGVIFRTQTFTFQRQTYGRVSFPLWPVGNNPGIVIVKIRSTQGFIWENMNVTQDATWAASGAPNGSTTPEQLFQNPTWLKMERYEEVTRTYIAGEGWYLHFFSNSGTGAEFSITVQGVFG